MGCSSPRNWEPKWKNQTSEKKLKKAAADLKKADELTEKATLAIFDVYHFLHFKLKNLTTSGQDIEKRTDRAHSSCGDARSALSDAHYQIVEALKKNLQ